MTYYLGVRRIKSNSRTVYPRLIVLPVRTRASPPGAQVTFDIHLAIHTWLTFLSERLTYVWIKATRPLCNIDCQPDGLCRVNRHEVMEVINGGLLYPKYWIMVDRQVWRRAKGKGVVFLSNTARAIVLISVDELCKHPSY